jgi:hypothetical protein
MEQPVLRGALIQEASDFGIYDGEGRTKKLSSRNAFNGDSYNRDSEL